MKKNILLLLLWVTLLYLIGAFIEVDFNPKNWLTNTRKVIGILFIVLMIAVMAYKIMFEDDSNHRDFDD